MILVTGGAGFIGSNFVNLLTQVPSQEFLSPVLVLDKLTYAGNLNNLVRCDNLEFMRLDVNDKKVGEVLSRYRPKQIVHFAAESHVDRSIDSADEFIESNVYGTCRLLEKTLAYYRTLRGYERENFRFIHISTDEVYGDIKDDDDPLDENSQIKPSNPYAATKAASDHMVAAFERTYDLPTITIRLSNNYGPNQFPEKLIPLTILNALRGRPIRIYGEGKNKRNWLHVSDAVLGIKAIMEKGLTGEIYNIGGISESTNNYTVNRICEIINKMFPEKGDIKSLITYVSDRPGHDYRYSLNSQKVLDDVGFSPVMEFEEGLEQTIRWYANNMNWVHDIEDKSYQLINWNFKG